MVGGWWVVVVVAYRILVSAQGPLVFGFGLKGLGPGLDNKLNNLLFALNYMYYHTADPDIILYFLILTLFARLVQFVLNKTYI